MGTETFNPDRLILSMQYSTALLRGDLAEALLRLACVPAEEAEHLVATAGEDEAGYGIRDRGVFLEALCKTADEFLADDDGGFHEMHVHVTSYERSPAVIEIWFQVGSPGSDRGVWFRHLVVGVDDQTVYAALGGGRAGTARR